MSSLDLAELPPVPAASATDDEMRAFAKQTMVQWSESWKFSDGDDSYVIALGTKNGMRFFDAREVHRGGCEPYDAYTRVVLDARVAYVVRAITVPGGPIEGWLAPFFDLPFSAHVKTALRNGPRPGPC